MVQRSYAWRRWSGAITRLVRGFGKGESGVVAVEWVALAGAVVIGAVAVAWPIANSLSTPAQQVGTNLTDCDSLGSPAGCN